MRRAVSSEKNSHFQSLGAPPFSRFSKGGIWLDEMVLSSLVRVIVGQKKNESSSVSLNGMNRRNFLKLAARDDSPGRGLSLRHRNPGRKLLHLR